MPNTHSPLPWTARARSASDGALVIKSPDYIEVCCIAEKSTRREGPDNDRQMADAALIVRAVNAHQALVAALETLDRIERGLQGWHEDAKAEAWAKARAALALARGEA